MHVLSRPVVPCICTDLPSPGVSMSSSFSATPTASAGAPPLNPRTRKLLEAPIARTLLQLGGPNVLVLVAQAAVGLIETYFIGKLGVDALSGVALVFPV